MSSLSVAAFSASMLVRMPPFKRKDAIIAWPVINATRRYEWPTRMRPGSTQSGVGLIEVLVAVLVLSIGFLGVAALEAMSLSTNNSAMARSMATVASYSILDAMRADLPNAVSGAYNTTVTASACPAAGTTLATNQLFQWCNTALKPLGANASTTGNIVCTAATGTNTANCTITIQFDDSRAGVGGASNQQVITKAML